MTEIRCRSAESIWRNYDLRREQNDKSVSRRVSDQPISRASVFANQGTARTPVTSPIIWPSYACCGLAKAARAQRAQAPQVSSLKILKSTLQYEAATIIQKWWRGAQAREALARLRLERSQSEARWQAALKIQALWHGYKVRQANMLSHYIALHTRARVAAAHRIQQAWIRWRRRQELELEHLVSLVGKLRTVSATVIQKWWRGIRVREIIDEEWNNWVIKWIWDKPGKEVSVVYKNKVIPMKFCSIRRCYVCKMPRRPGRYEIKFLVDGRLVCCGTGTLIHSAEKQFSNVYDVYQTPLPSCFEKCRVSLSKMRSLDRGGRDVASTSRELSPGHWRRRRLRFSSIDLTT